MIMKIIFLLLILEYVFSSDEDRDVITYEAEARVMNEDYAKIIVEVEIEKDQKQMRINVIRLVSIQANDTSHIYFNEKAIIVEPASRDKHNVIKIPDGIEFDDMVKTLTKPPDPDGKVPDVLCDAKLDQNEKIHGKDIDNRFENCRYYTGEDAKDGEHILSYCLLIGAMTIDEEVKLACYRGGRIVRNNS